MQRCWKTPPTSGLLSFSTFACGKLTPTTSTSRRCFELASHGSAAVGHPFHRPSHSSPRRVCLTLRCFGLASHERSAVGLVPGEPPHLRKPANTPSVGNPRSVVHVRYQTGLLIRRQAWCTLDRMEPWLAMGASIGSVYILWRLRAGSGATGRSCFGNIL